jgi:hypothetical protein
MHTTARNRFVYPLALLALFGCGGAERGTTISADESVQPGAVDDTPVTGWASHDPGPSCAKAATVSLASSTWSEADAEGTCHPSVGARTFSHALCSCEDTNVAGFLKTRSFHSRGAAPGVERLGGSVGVNRNYFTGGLADVGGSFSVAGPRDVLFGGLLKTGSDLRFNPSFDVAGLVGVGGDAHLNGALRAVGLIGIDGDLHRSPDSRFLGLALVSVHGQNYTEAVDVGEPCSCGAGAVLDIASRVADAANDNDNASVGLDEHALDLVAGIGTALTLPSGRFFLHQVSGVGAIRLRISGKVELHIEDDFFAGPLFAVTLDPDAEVDIFVRDNLVLAGAALLGDPARPSATRIYVGGTGDIAVAGLNAFAGNLYAPTANVLVGGIGKVYGSLFGKNVIAAGILDVGFDESVLDGVECTPPAQPPVEEPPVVEPPATDDPPAAEPPVTDPPANDPPAHNPPASEPPANDPPSHETPTPSDPVSPPVVEMPSPCEPAGTPTLY